MFFYFPQWRPPPSGVGRLWAAVIVIVLIGEAASLVSSTAYATQGSVSVELTGNVSRETKRP